MIQGTIALAAFVGMVLYGQQCLSQDYEMPGRSQ